MISHTDSELKDLLKIHEGFKLLPYEDTVGKLTIGVGRNLTDRGITKFEAELMLENDLKVAIGEIELYFPWVGRFSRPRQLAMIDMCFNMGIRKLRGFKKMLIAAASQDFDLAAKEMLDSAWAVQVGARATTLADMMRRG